MNKFKAGDKIRCINNISNLYSNKPILNNIYTIKDYYHNGDYNLWIRVKEGNILFLEKDFELVQKKEKHYKWNIEIHTIEAILLPSGHTEKHKKKWIESDHYVSEEKIESYLTNYIQDKYECEILEYDKIKDAFKEE